jgi:hypothetical protein
MMVRIFNDEVTGPGWKDEKANKRKMEKIPPDKTLSIVFF